MTEETRETCRRLFERACQEVYEPMFDQQKPAPPPPWQPTPAAPQDNGVTVRHITPPQTMTMRKFCHYLFKNNQDTMLAIVQSNREQRRKASDASHPFLYRRSHDEAAVKALLKLASDKNITITGTLRQQVDSYSEYRADYLNYKSCVKKDKRKMNIPVAATPTTPTGKAISTFVSDSKITETIQLATRLTTLDAKKKACEEQMKKAEEEIKKLEFEQRDVIRQMNKITV